MTAEPRVVLLRTEISAPAPGGSLLGHPKGVFLVAATEFWERFSYWGMMGLLVLYLAAPTIENGFGWERAEALRLYGLYAGLVFATPAVGGWLSSRYLGERRCILVGGITVALGHFLLGGPAYWSALIERVSDVPVHALLHESGVTLGRLFPSGEVWQQLANQLERAGYPPAGVATKLPWLQAAYLLVGWSFMIGLACIVMGTGFIKPTISSIIGKFYAPGDVRREAGFTIFMVGIWSGGLVANFIAGTLGEKLGWQYGFTAAGFGMTLGVVLYLWKQQPYLGEIGRRPDRDHVRQQPPVPTVTFTMAERERLWVVGVMGMFTILYATAFYQKGGLIHLMVKDSVDRTVWGFEVPATWFLTISTAGFVVLAPVASWLWRWLGQRGRALDAVEKQAIGLLAMATSYVFLLVAAVEHERAGAVSMGWIVTAYLGFSVGEVCIWPPQITAASKLAPERIASFVIGSWYVTVGSGTFLAGWVGASAYTFSTTGVFAALLAACATGAGLLLLLRRRLVRMMHGVSPI